MNQDWIIFCGPDSSWKYLQQNLWRQSFEDVSHSALKKFADFLGKHLCAGASPATLWKKGSGPGIILWTLQNS